MAVPAIDLVTERLHNQRLARTDFRTPAEVVAWLGAVQAQDYTGAKWAVGQRAARLTDADIDRAFNDGTILRTHIMRPTWHFVVPADIRFMLALTAPRVHAVSAYYYRQQALDAKVFARSRTVLERALGDRTYLTRIELKAALQRAGIAADSLRLGLLLMRAELDQVICSGPRRGKQCTYALLAERAPQARLLEPDQALAELTKRYFTSHGPGTVRDYVWWSGLTVGQAKRGIEIVRPALASETLDDLTYWFVPSRAIRKREAVPAYLLPNYDEYGIAYKDRGAMVDATLARPPLYPDGVNEFAHLLIVNGRWTGSWKRTLTAAAARVDVRPARTLTKEEQRAVAAAGVRYGKFLKLPMTLAWSDRHR